MLMMPLPGPSRPGRGPTDADDARLAGFSRPGRGPTDADDARHAQEGDQLMLTMLAGFSRPARNTN